MALVGYTNAGKSALQERLAPRPKLERRASDALFASLDTHERRGHLGVRRGRAGARPPRLLQRARRTAEEVGDGLELALVEAREHSVHVRPKSLDLSILVATQWLWQRATSLTFQFVSRLKTKRLFQRGKRSPAVVLVFACYSS